MTIHVHMVRSSMLDFECLSPQVYGRPSLGCLAKIQFETSLQFHGFFPHSRHTFWISQVYVDESSSYLYIISEGEVYTLLSTKFCCTSCSPVIAVIVPVLPLCQVMLSYHGISIETRRSLECFSEFAFLCRGLSIQMYPNAAFIRSVDSHDEVSLVQKLKWKMKYQKFKIQGFI